MKQPKRPHMPLGVKLAACLIRLGYNPREVVWDHSPPLAMRRINRAGTDWIPSANDPNNIVPLSKAEHKLKTHGSHVPLSGDVSKIAKMKRIIRKQKVDTSDIPEADEQWFKKASLVKHVWPKRKIQQRRKP